MPGSAGRVLLQWRPDRRLRQAPSTFPVDPGTRPRAAGRRSPTLDTAVRRDRRDRRHRTSCRPTSSRSAEGLRRLCHAELRQRRPCSAIVRFVGQYRPALRRHRRAIGSASSAFRAQAALGIDEPYDVRCAAVPPPPARLRARRRRCRAASASRAQAPTTTCRPWAGDGRDQYRRRRRTTMITCCRA